MAKNKIIPVCEPFLGGREMELVKDAVSSGWISSAGHYIDEFQNSFAQYHNVKHCVAVANGTAALEVSLHAIGIEKGDHVIIPSFTIMSLALAVLRLGAVPRVVDVDPDSWNITAEAISLVLTEKTRAIIVVHSFGQPVDMDPILELIQGKDVKLIEDTAESIGSSYKGQLCGAIGDIGSFSFYANKLITTGEGGCILTNSDKYAERASRYVNMYFGKNERFAHDDLGYNFRMTNLQAAIGCAQLEKIDDILKRNSIIEGYLKKYSTNVNKAAKNAMKTTVKLLSPTIPVKITDGVMTKIHTSIERKTAPIIFATTSFPFNLDAADTMPTACSNLSPFAKTVCLDLASFVP